jgi:hypothetical protein
MAKLYPESFTETLVNPAPVFIAGKNTNAKKQTLQFVLNYSKALEVSKTKKGIFLENVLN